MEIAPCHGASSNCTYLDHRLALTVRINVYIEALKAEMPSLSIQYRPPFGPLMRYQASVTRGVGNSVGGLTLHDWLTRSPLRSNSLTDSNSDYNLTT